LYLCTTRNNAAPMHRRIVSRRPGALVYQNHTKRTYRSLLCITRRHCSRRPRALANRNCANALIRRPYVYPGGIVVGYPVRSPIEIADWQAVLRCMKAALWRVLLNCNWRAQRAADYKAAAGNASAQNSRAFCSIAIGELTEPPTTMPPRVMHHWLSVVVSSSHYIDKRTGQPTTI
jgi:hypothetical protein